MPSPIRRAALLLGAACLPAAAPAQTATITHARGDTVVAAPPRKVAVFDLATLDNLNALGIEAVAGVPRGTGERSNLPTYLARYADARYANVGSLFEPDAAALTALKPDLIIVGGRSARSYDAMTAIAPTIDLSVADKGPDAAAIANVRALGRAFAVRDRAERLVADLEVRTTALRATGRKAGTALLLFGTSAGVGAQAPGDRFGTVYDFTGLRSVLPARTPAAGGRPTGARPAAGTPEAEAAGKARAQELAAAIAADPDWLLVIDREAAVGTAPSTISRTLATDPTIAASRAWKAGRVVYLDPKTWYLVGAGITALSRSAEDVAATLRAQR